MKRKDFIKKGAMALAIGLPIVTVMQSCGSDDPSLDDDGDPDGTANCIDNGTNVNITANHGHSLVVPKEDVVAGVEKTYSIMGSSSHNHDVTISAANFQTLQQNQTITVSSNSSSGHAHNVSVSCA